jgi:hypothetical protein
MTDAGYIVAGYIAAFAGLGGYAAWVLLRGRSLTRQVPADRRRWSETSE